jgi:NTE family protein
MAPRSNVSGPRIGIALSGGGAAAMAHIGVLEELSAAGIEIDCVAGTSAGAMVGAAFAAGRLRAFRDTMCALTRGRVLRLFDPTWPRTGLLEGRRSLKLVRAHLGDRIETLPIPYAAVAADLHSSEEVILREGEVIEAIRASIAIPGLFTPLRSHGRLLVDGGLVNPVPVDVARQLGADFVIAVSVLKVPVGSLPNGRARRGLTQQWLDRLLTRQERSPTSPAKGTEPSHTQDADLGLIDVLLRASTLVQARIAAARLREQPPDCLISVPVQTIGLFDFHRTAEATAAGHSAARQALPDLLAALAATAPLSHRISRWVDEATARWGQRRCVRVGRLVTYHSICGKNQTY